MEQHSFDTHVLPIRKRQLTPKIEENKRSVNGSFGVLLSSSKKEGLHTWILFSSRAFGLVLAVAACGCIFHFHNPRRTPSWKSQVALRNQPPHSA